MRGALAVAAAVSITVSTAAAATTTKPRTTPAPWPAPNDALGPARNAGLTSRTREYFAYHVHAHLDVFVNATRVLVPAGIGINIKDPGVKHIPVGDGTTGYGGIRECKHPCISPLHTHADDGVLHTESPQAHPNRLGQFFTEWNVRFGKSCVGAYCKPRRRVTFYVDGKPYRGDPRGITLTDGKEIAIVIGKPPAAIPSHFPR